MPYTLMDAMPLLWSAFFAYSLFVVLTRDGIYVRAFDGYPAAAAAGLGLACFEVRPWVQVLVFLLMMGAALLFEIVIRINLSKNNERRNEKNNAEEIESGNCNGIGQRS